MSAVVCAGRGGRWVDAGCWLAVSAAVAVAGLPMLGQQTTPARGAAKHAAVRPMLTGTNGSTGTAAFQGNLTTILAPGGDVLGLARQTDCSLTYGYGNYSLNTGSDMLAGTVQDNYQDVLHKEAGLTSTADVFASGCVAPTTGLGTQQEVYVGTTTSGIAVFAGIGYDPAAMANGLYVATSSLSSGTLSPTGAYSTNYALTVNGFSTASVLTTADLNKDGNGDLVVANSVLTTSGSVSVLLGKADGTFQTAVSYATAGPGTAAVVIEDVNGDGKLDIVALSSATGSGGNVDQEISVLLGKGDGTFGAAQSFTVPALPGSTNEYSTPIANIITADLRGNGKKDLICSNGQVFLGNGDGTFTAETTPAFPYETDSLSTSGPYLASGDLNNDGKADVVLSDGSTISTYLGKGDGTFTAGASYASIGNGGEVAVSDLDGDGDADIYSGIANGGLYVGDQDDPNLSYALMGYGNGTFAGAPDVNGTGVYGAYTGTNLGDVNGDGIPDLITLGTSSSNVVNSTFTVNVGSKSGIFSPVSTFGIPASAVVNGTTVNGSSLSLVAYAVGDINGDGKADVVFITNGASSLSFSGLIYWTALSNGDGTFAAPVPHEMPQLAPPGENDSSVQTIAGLQITPLSSGGKAAILFGFYENIYTTQNVYLQGLVALPGNGDGTFGAAAIDYTSNGPSHALISPPDVVSVADLNGDGKMDLISIATPLVYNAAGGNYLPTYNAGGAPENELQVYLGNGDGTFGAAATVTTVSSLTVPQYPAANSPCALADFNKDNHLDLACPGEDANGNTVLAVALGNGDGTFASPTVMNLTPGVSDNQGGIEGGIAAADFNGDGNVDLALIVFNSYSGILYGNGDGTFTSVSTSNGIVPKDLINLGVGSPVNAVDLNGDGKPDLLAGNTVLLNEYGTTSTLAGSTTTLSASATAVTAGASVKFTATVAGVSGSTGTPTGTVTFYDGTTELGTGTLSSGVATYTTTTLPVGSDSITATYGGDSNFSGSTSTAVVVVVSSTVTAVGTSTALTASPSNAVSGTSVGVTATVTAASGTAVPTGTVTFKDGSTTLGTGTLNGSGVATYMTSSLGVGSHSITAVYGGATGFTGSTSGVVTVTITAAAAPGYAVSVSPASGSVAAGGSVSATISVTPAGGFSAAVSLACSGAPANATCSVSPASVTPNGGAATATLMIATDVATMSARRGSLPGNGAPVVLLSGGALLGWALLRRRRRQGWYVQLGIALVLLAAGAVAGCGGSGSTANKTPTGTYSLTVTGTSGGTTETGTYSLTVQ